MSSELRLRYGVKPLDRDSEEYKIRRQGACSQHYMKTPEPPLLRLVSFLNRRLSPAMKITATFLFGLLAPVTFAQQLCAQYAYHSSSGYEFNNNMWGSGSGQGNQCTNVEWVNSNGCGWRVNWQWANNRDNVKSYPYSGKQMNPKRLVSQWRDIQSTASWGYSGSNIRANVAYDLFTHSNPDNPTHNGEYEIMIW